MSLLFVRHFLISLLVCATLVSNVTAVAATQAVIDKKPTAENRADAQQRLKEVEKHRRELQERLHETRRQEQQALRQLDRIKRHLNATQDILKSSKNQLNRTERNLHETAHKIVETKSQEDMLTDEAGNRLREIYEGQRLGLIEMVFQVSSLQSLLDLFYFQERIAALDRTLLDDLRQKAINLAQRKNQLGSRKNQLGDLVSEFARKTLQLNKAKDDQEQVADRLRTQRSFYEQAERQLAQESNQLERQIVDMCHGKEGKHHAQSSGLFAMPLRASITSPFGWRRHPIFGVRKFHTGIDIAGANHSAIHAADGGSVIYSGWYGGYGKVVIVSHGKGMATLYAHMSKLNVSSGASVRKGDVVGYEGTTGFSTGPHLHFEVRVDGKPNNPLAYVK